MVFGPPVPVGGGGKMSNTLDLYPAGAFSSAHRVVLRDAPLVRDRHWYHYQGGGVLRDASLVRDRHATGTTTGGWGAWHSK